MTLMDLRPGCLLTVRAVFMVNGENIVASKGYSDSKR